MDVHFRLKYTISDLWFSDGGSHIFDYDGPHSIRVELGEPSAEDQARGHKNTNAHCTAFARVQANERNNKIFAAIRANEILPASGERVALEYTGQDGTGILVPSLSEFPEHFRSFVRGVEGELSDYARRTVSVLRWRIDHFGRHDLLAHAA